MAKLLALDAGNSNIVLGLYCDDLLLHQWRIHTDRRKMADEYADLFRSLLAWQGVSPEDIDDIAVSNVVPSLQTLLENLALNHFQKEAFFVSGENILNMTIKIDNPRELGADLIAAAAAAIEKYGPPCIVLDFGTATTVMAVNKEREFLGGAIAPGLAVSREALYTYAPHLPRVKLESPPSVIGANTVHAMQAGLFTGYRYMIENLVRDMQEVMGTHTRVIATGGLAETFVKAGSLLDTVDPCLVLDGIKLLHTMNRQKCTGNSR